MSFRAEEQGQPQTRTVRALDWSTLPGFQASSSTPTRKWHFWWGDSSAGQHGTLRVQPHLPRRASEEVSTRGNRDRRQSLYIELPAYLHRSLYFYVLAEV